MNQNNNEIIEKQTDQSARLFDQWLESGAQGSFTISEEITGPDDLTRMLFAGSPWRRLKQAWRGFCAYLGSLTSFSGWKAFWFRRAGAKIGRNVCLAPGVAIDTLLPHLISIEDEAVLGPGSMIHAHLKTSEGVVVGRVRIGQYSVVGARTVVGNTVTVGAQGVLGSCSFFFNGMVPENGMFTGAPAVVRNAA